MKVRALRHGLSLIFCMSMVGVLTTIAFAEPNIEAGAQKAETLCMACHGPKGISTNPIWPSLYGQKEQYLIKSMKDYKSGVRQDPLMTQQAQLLSDRDIENLAAYYSQFRLEANQQ